MRDVFLRYTLPDGSQYCDVAPDVRNVETYMAAERGELDAGWTVEEITEAEYFEDDRRVAGHRASVLTIDQPEERAELNCLGDPADTQYRIDVDADEDLDEVVLGRAAHGLVLVVDINSSAKFWIPVARIFRLKEIR